MEFVAALGLAVLAYLIWLTFTRIQKLDRDQLATQQEIQRLSRQLDQLALRVDRERRVAAPNPASPKDPMSDGFETPSHTQPEAPSPLPTQNPLPETLTARSIEPPPLPEPPLSEESVPAEEAAPLLSQEAPMVPASATDHRPKRSRDEWEALVGGKLLNRIGALALVIGMVLSFVLLLAARSFRLPSLRLQGLLTALPAFLFASLQANDQALTTAASLSVALLFLLQFLLPRDSATQRSSFLAVPERDGRLICSVLGAALMTFVLYCQFPGGWLTTAWGLEGLSLLILGFPLRERPFRLEGLVLLVVCILKLSFTTSGI